MSEYTYTGVNQEGKTIQGNLQAKDEGEARMILRSQGVRPVKMAKKGIFQSDIGGLIRGAMGSKIPLSQVVPLTSQLYVLVNAGIPLIQALELLTGMIKHPELRNIMASTREKVSQGAFFWESLAAYPNAFPKIYVALIRAGESSGSLDVMFDRLSKYMENALKLRRLIKGALTYPVMVILVALGVIVGMLTFVIPKIQQLLQSNNQELPAITQFVITLSEFTINNFLYIFLGTIGFIVLVQQYVRTPAGRAYLDQLMFSLPLFGALTQKAGIARFSRTMATLLGAGVNMLDAIDVCKTTMDNRILENATTRLKQEVEKGRTIGQTMSQLNVFPPMATQMIAIGETTGNLDQMFTKVADFYEKEVEDTVSNLSKLIEPLMIVVLGGIVGGLLVAMYLPIMKMASGAVGD